jgi:type VI secretion system secreted protein Hcp
MLSQLPHFRARILSRLAAAAAALAAAPVFAALDTFMKIDGIPGDSVVIGHVDEIVLSSYSQAFGTKNCSRVIAEKFLDRASPPLVAAAVANQIVPTVVITLRKAGEAPQDFYKAILTSVLIERIDIDVSEDGDSLDERVVLKPRSIRIEYRPQRPDGSLGQPIVSDVTCT